MGRPRIRVFANDVDVNYGTEKTLTSGVVTKTVSKTNSSSFLDQMVDYVTPNFRERQKQGEIVMNPMTHSIYSVKNPPGSSSFITTATGSGWLYEDLNPTVLQLTAGRAAPVGDDPDSVRIDPTLSIARAKLSALERIDSTPFNFMEDVAEIGSTIRQLRNPLTEAKALARSFEDKFYRLRRKKHLTSAQCFSNAWLSTRYGFRPIIMSMLNAHSALEVASMRKPNRRTARAMIEETDELSGTFYRPFWVGSANRDYYSFEKSVYDTRRATVIYEAPLLTEPLDLLGLRSKAIPRTAYNLMPYSWVIDRFVSIGSTISALMNLADPRIRILGACVAGETVTNYKVTFTGQVQSGFTNSTTNTPSETTSTIRTRELWHPSVADTQPIVLPRIDGQFALDLASLVVQRLRLPSFSSR